MMRKHVLIKIKWEINEGLRRSWQKITLQDGVDYSMKDSSISHESYPI